MKTLCRIGLKVKLKRGNYAITPSNPLNTVGEIVTLFPKIGGVLSNIKSNDDIKHIRVLWSNGSKNTYKVLDLEEFVKEGPNHRLTRVFI